MIDDAIVLRLGRSRPEPDAPEFNRITHYAGRHCGKPCSSCRRSPSRYVLFGSGDRSAKIKISPNVFRHVTKVEIIADLAVQAHTWSRSHFLRP